MTNFRTKIGLVFSVSLMAFSNAGASERCGVVKSLKYYYDSAARMDQIEVSFVDGTFVKDVNQPMETSLIAAIAGSLRVCLTSDSTGGLHIASISK